MGSPHGVRGFGSSNLPVATSSKFPLWDSGGELAGSTPMLKGMHPIVR